MAKNSLAFFAFILILFVLAISEITSVKGELCEKASKTWSGNCGNTRHCDDQCKSWEKAAHGACHVRNKKHMCFCYFNCREAEKLAQDKLNSEELVKNKIKDGKDLHLEHPVKPIEHPLGHPVKPVEHPLGHPVKPVEHPLGHPVKPAQHP